MRPGYPAKFDPFRIGAAPPRLRREFGAPLIALLPNPAIGARNLELASEVAGGKSNYTLVPNASPTWPTLITNRFGPALRWGPTGAAVANTWGLGSTSFIPSGGITKGTFIVAGQAQPNLANNYRAVIGNALGGQNSMLYISGHSWFGMSFNQSASGPSLAHYFTITGGALGCAVWSWHGGTSYDAFCNGSSGGGTQQTNNMTTAGSYANLVGVGVAPTYAIGVDVNLALVSDRDIPRGLASDVSFDPWAAFEPERKSFFYSTGAADTTAPTFDGGSVITASSVTHAAFDLSWPAATDAVGVTQYRYRIDAGAWQNTGTTRTASISGKAAGTGYDIEVCAGDAADNWSTALELTVTTLAIKVNPSIYDPAAGTARASQTGLGLLVLGEKPGATATPTVLAYSATEATDGSGVLDVNLNTAGVDPGDVVWVVMVKSDGTPANAGYSLCWPVTVVAA
jgi:hypothetical protein